MHAVMQAHAHLACHAVARQHLSGAAPSTGTGSAGAASVVRWRPARQRRAPCSPACMHACTRHTGTAHDPTNAHVHAVVERQSRQTNKGCLATPRRAAPRCERTRQLASQCPPGVRYPACSGRSHACMHACTRGRVGLPSHHQCQAVEVTQPCLPPEARSNRHHRAAAAVGVA